MKRTLEFLKLFQHHINRKVNRKVNMVLLAIQAEEMLEDAIH
jgi:hypothetical protein